MSRRLIQSIIIMYILAASCLPSFAQNPTPPMPPGAPPPPPSAPYDELQQIPPPPPPPPPAEPIHEQAAPPPAIVPVPPSQNTQTRPPQPPKPPPSSKKPTDQGPKPPQPILAPENVAPVPTGPGRNWPMFRSDSAHTGMTEERLNFPLKLAWKFIADLATNNPSSPAVVDGVVYFCSGGRLYALNADTGTMRWRYPAEESLAATIKSSPVVGDDLVYFGAGDGKLYAVTKSDGNLAWIFATKGIMNSSPVLVDGVIYVGSSDDHLYAVNALSPDLEWGGGLRTRDDIVGSPAVADGIVYFLSNDMMLYAAETVTGRLKWQVRVGNWSAAATPVISDNTLYIASGNTIQSFQAKSGRFKWSVKFSSDITTIPAVANGSIYLGCKNGRVYALTSVGKLKWPVPGELGSAAYGSPIVAGDVVIIGANRGTLAAFDGEKGALRWKYLVQPSSLDYGKVRYVNLASSPAVSNGALFVLADDGALHAFRYDAPDSTPPDLTPFVPPRDYLMPGAPPTEYAALVVDEGSGIREDTISMAVDGQTVEHRFAPERGIVWYRSEGGPLARPLADGVHSAMVSVSDWAGNKSGITWHFTVNNLIRRASKVAPPTSEATTGRPAPIRR
ncbi:MAG: PQQ-binding-like beta-propeller repeat protein [Armatimonadetes bacterium]|nr:PQQ-binding-like beta-propeller repeat protein [Armatimonadota bacterium]